MGADHARIFAEQILGTSLHFICGADAESAKKIADDTGALNISSCAFAVINDKNVDDVVIAVPDQFHASLALAFIAAEKSVLCEKPLSPLSQE